MMVDKFLKRSLLYNAQMMDAIRQHGLMSVDVNAASVDKLTEKCLSLLGLEHARLRPERKYDGYMPDIF